MDNLERLGSIKSYEQLIKYLGDPDGLGWEFETEDIEDLTYDYSSSEFGLSAKSAAPIREIKQLRPLVGGQPWGIFYLDFRGEKISVTALRAILRGLVTKKRGSANQSDMKKWRVEDLLFICTSDNFTNFNFAYFHGTQTTNAVLSTFGWRHGDTHLRTLAEYNVPALRFPSDPGNAEEWLDKWRTAFDVEVVTSKFFEDYHDIFLLVETEVKNTITSDETARLYTQRLFNRLMFIYFIQKKGWLSFNGNKAYLRALFEASQINKENFLRDRLYWLFFSGMSNVSESREVHSLEILRERRGEVPYLNGGLFDMEDEWDERDKVSVSNEAFSKILDLFERYNFTVEESTPLNVQVAVDPEMLGKVFEELVTGRHESGSYYTPRLIVSFMCREALKHYLTNTLPAEASDRFVDLGDGSGLLNPEGVLEALRRLRVCDPACGSGAYLLGMMQELLRLRGALFVSQNIGDDSVYEIKRSIIENNLYGVDNDPFAVQIAALRLWLSLAIDSDKPQPLPNLDFKIECGDSLTGPAPSVDEKTLFFERHRKVREYVELKNRFARASGERKRALRDEIENVRIELAAALKHTVPRPSVHKIEYLRAHTAELRKDLRHAERGGNKTKATTLQRQLQLLMRKLTVWDKASVETDGGFDWAVEFAEVFMPQPAETGPTVNLRSVPNDSKGQGNLIDEPDLADSGGFDIIVANPPYVSALAFSTKYSAQKREQLRKSYQTARGAFDLYVLFYERSIQLLRPEGFVVLINPNKFLSARYALALRQFIMSQTTFLSLVDISGIRIFRNAAVYPVITMLKAGPTHFYKSRLRLPTIRQMDEFDLEEFAEIEVDNQKLTLLPELIWGFLLSSEFPLLARLLAGGKPLSALGSVNATSTAGESDEYGSHITNRKGDDGLRIINTGTIDRYASLWGIREMTHGGNRFLTPHLPLAAADVNQRRKEMYLSPKIIFAKMARVAEAYLDYQGDYASINTNCFYQPKSGVDIRYIAAFCNSRIFMFIYEQFFGALRMSGGYFQFQAPQLRVIPVRVPSENVQCEFGSYVDEIQHLKKRSLDSDTRELEQTIDRLLYELYELTPDDIARIDKSA